MVLSESSMLLTSSCNFTDSVGTKAFMLQGALGAFRALLWKTDYSPARTFEDEDEEVDDK
jgi:hypothetical protein